MIEYTLTDRVAVVSLADPRVHNAMGVSWPTDLVRAMDQALAADPIAVVLRGVGPSFCSGVNTRDYAAGRLASDWFRAADQALLAVDQAPVPVIAVIHGYCLGGGLQLATACDVRIAAASAVLGLPAQQESLIPGLSFLRLSRLIGASWAADLVLTGQLLNARTARDIGLVTRTPDDDDVEEELAQVLNQIRSAPDVVARSKQLLASVRLDGYPGFEAALHDAMNAVIASSETGRMAVSRPQPPPGSLSAEPDA